MWGCYMQTGTPLALASVAILLFVLLCVPTEALFGMRKGRIMEAAKLMRNKRELATDPLPTDINRNDMVPQHSFDPPLLRDFPWDSGLIHWDFGLAATATDAYVRLTPSKQSREGYLWNDVPCYLRSWTANFGFRVSSLSSLGGDGFAFWYTDVRSTSGGPLFGARSSNFRGLGIVFDSFDNDGSRDNPAVHVIIGSGDDEFNAQTDLKETRAAGCVFDFRNTQPNELVRAMVEYDPDSGVRVTLTSARQQNVCATVEPLTLPEGFYFGFTAHTGHLADNHDLHYFAVTATAADRKREAESAAAAAAAAATATSTGEAQQLHEDQAGLGVRFSHDEDKKERARWK